VRALSANERSMLRYWAVNIEAAGYAFIGFGYDADERHRFAAIRAAMPSGAYAAWLAATLPLYGIALSVSVALFFGPLLVAYPRGTQIADTVFLVATAGMLVSTLSVGLPLAMMLGGRLVDWASSASSASPLAELPGDAGLYRKIRYQIGRMAVVGAAAVGLLNWVTWEFGADLTQHDSAVRWTYYGVLAAQALLGCWFARTRR
jgi:hypothetical protein